MVLTAYKFLVARNINRLCYLDHFVYIDLCYFSVLFCIHCHIQTRELTKFGDSQQLQSGLLVSKTNGFLQEI